jgi:secreted PhoX family phosphatase
MKEEIKPFSWQLNHNEEGIVELNATGTIDTESSQAQTKEVFDYARKVNSYLFLLNFREVTGESTPLRIYELPRIYHNLGVPRQSKIAVVLPQPKDKSEDYEFYETVCYNHGYEVELFEEKKHALDWLRLHRISDQRNAP